MIDYRVIEQACKEQNTEAINRIISYYQPLILSKARKRVRDDDGNEYTIVDAYVKQHIEIDLILAILKFKL